MACAAAGARVIVLDAAYLEPGGWHSGQAAIVAELRANGYDVELHPSSVRIASDLDIELESLLLEPGVAGAVAIWREGERGVAEVKTARSGLERLTTQLADDALSRSRLALAVVDRVRLVDIPRLAPAPRPPPALAAHRSQRVSFLSMGVGVVNVGPGAMWPWVAASGGLLIFPPFGVEGSVGLSLSSPAIHTRQGEVALRAEQAIAYVAFEPLAGRRLSLALGLGGGAVWVHGNPSPSAGFKGEDAVARVALLGARARGSLSFGRALIALTLEPGLLIPSVQLMGDGSTLETLGRPWLSANISCGWLL